MNDIWPLIPSDLQMAIRLSRVSQGLLAIMTNSIQSRMSDPSYDDLLSVGIKRYYRYDVQFTSNNVYSNLVIQPQGYMMLTPSGSFVPLTSLSAEELFFMRVNIGYAIMLTTEPASLPLVNINAYKIYNTFQTYRFFMIGKQSRELPTTSLFGYNRQLRVYVADHTKSHIVLRTYKNWILNHTINS